MALRDRLPFLGQDPGREVAPTDAMLGHTAPAPSTEEQPRPSAGTVPIGQSGRANFYGLPQSEELNQLLVGPMGLRRLDEMYRTDAHVRRLVLAAWSPIVAGTWTLAPYGGEDASDTDRKIADDIWWLLTEWMSPNFYEHLYQIGPLLIRSGFLPCEQVGWSTVERNGRTLLCPRKLDPRIPKSIWRWWQDDFGDLTYIGQILPNRADVVIPAGELVYYRLGAEGDNWQGTSLLRHAWKHWFLKDKLERIDAVGQERKAVGVPVVYPPKGADVQTKRQVERILANLHMSEVAYVMMPGPKAGSQGAQGVPQDEWLLDVIKFDSSSGEGIFNSINYHQTAIAASFLTDFLELGHHQVGARATAEVQEDPFLTAINGALLPPVVPPLNRFIDRIRRLNWKGAEGSPTLELTLHDEASLSEIAAYVTPLVQAGAMQVDPELEDWLRDRAGMPAANADIRKQNLDAEQAGAEAAAEGLARSGEEPGAEPTNPDKPPGANPIAGAVEKTGEIPAAGKKLSKAERRAERVRQLAEESDRTLAEIDREMDELLELEQATPQVEGAGIILQAADTGRVLVIQRTPDDGDDQDVFASCEFPGGGVDDDAAAGDSSPWQTARREFEEEVGCPLPSTAERLGTFTSPDGAYRAFVLRIGSETDVQLGRSDREEVADVEWRHPGSLEGGTMSDRAQLLVPGLQRVLGSKQLDAPSPPPNLRVSESTEDQEPEHECGTCTMFDRGLCWGYGNFPTREEWVCDSWELSQNAEQQDSEADAAEGGANPKAPQRQLDAAASGSSTSDEGAKAEPTAKWFERLLSQDRLREAFDGAREHIQTTCSPQALTLARQLAHQAANRTPMTAAEPPSALTDALSAHYADLYQLGHHTVVDELQRQRRAIGTKLDDPAGPDALSAAGAERLKKARQRGGHSARNILGAIQERLGRDQITALKSPAALTAAAEQAATAQLRVEALANAGASINDGRNDAAMSSADVVGAYYTSVLDKSTCAICEAADTGDMLAPQDAVSLGPPNPDCEGGDFCRCTLVWVISSDPAALAAA